MNAYSSYVQRPVVWIFLHEAFVGQTGLPTSVFSAGLQMRAHADGVEEPDFVRAHVGLAVAPSGTSVGHGELGLQLGEQKEPLMPVICTASSPVEHGPALGSS